MVVTFTVFDILSEHILSQNFEQEFVQLAYPLTTHCTFFIPSIYQIIKYFKGKNLNGCRYRTWLKTRKCLLNLWEKELLSRVLAEMFGLWSPDPKDRSLLAIQCDSPEELLPYNTSYLGNWSRPGKFHIQIKFYKWRNK